MDIRVMHNESEEGEIVSDFEEDFTEELCNLPHILKFICKLRNHIRKQRKKINKLRNKLDEQKHQNLLSAKTFVDCGTQTDPLNLDKSLLQDWNISNDVKSSSIVDQVKQVAESALFQSGFVYEETSGMYYDYNTGYYYDTSQGLYYDGNTGIYYYYDEASNTYQFHSQVCVNEDTTVQLPISQKKEERKTGKTDKDDVKKRKIISEEDSEDKEPEEGECSENEKDDISDEISPNISTNSESDSEEESDLAKSYPPCMRIITKETDLPKLKVGSLFLVTCIGGTLGREGDHSVLIPDINVSKHHARFIYDETKKQYRIIDSASRNGTFLDGKRLSVAKQESEAHEIKHGSVIKVGGTKLLCHIHNGNETCGHCEPGLVQQNISLDENKASKKELHKEELRRLKHKFGFAKDNIISSQLASGYQDRAQARRQYVGSSHHRVKTEQTSVHTSIAKDNKGFKILSKMGWSEGHSLGKDGDGITEPVSIRGNYNKAGIGSSEADFPNIELDSNMEKKQTMWRKTQERYKEIRD
ncbi:angiogenic factor with G patch and FHA domains 1 isoform X1 [Camponotus floridanus]|uniref:angiogenic factor with G patch and FHA domains 1 isoform X1 n=1 Tax=Camponotus floridanus TaxID=104421 RepID=UPI00059D94B0|nr:angiogenic factor with G patch and FHA domains 1 isoform X1 [Camponotus floridanus]XP_025263453.1 angiogenic factor with G patch and FHA domains 1 isoform X1 [Camponotus floridanus]